MAFTERCSLCWMFPFSIPESDASPHFLLSSACCKADLQTLSSPNVFCILFSFSSFILAGLFQLRMARKRTIGELRDEKQAQPWAAGKFFNLMDLLLVELLQFRQELFSTHLGQIQWRICMPSSQVLQHFWYATLPRTPKSPHHVPS